MATVDIADTTIHHERVGSGPPLLFVHGMCGSADSWADQARRLADRFDCVRYDRRGHTRSARGTAQISDAQHADDAARLIESLDLAPCLVVASSSGAVITVELLLRHPHLLRGVVLSEPPLFSLAPGTRDAAMAEIGPAVAQAEAAGEPRMFVDGFFPIVGERFWAELDEAGRDRYRANAEIALEDLRGPHSECTVADLARMTVPALVLTGDSSPAFFGSICRTLVDALPDARLVELADSGHVTYFEQPVAFEHAVATFANELDRRTPATGGQR